MLTLWQPSVRLPQSPAQANVSEVSSSAAKLLKPVVK